MNFDDPQIDVVSLNGVHGSISVNNLPNGGYTEYQPDLPPTNSSRLYTIKIRRGESGFGFTVADSPSGQRVKGIFDKQRCQDLCENDLLLSINGQDLHGKTHGEVVEVLMKCSKEMDTVFVIRRGKTNSCSSIVNGVSERRKKSHRRTSITLFLYTSDRREQPLIPSQRLHFSLFRFECDKTSLVDIDVFSSKKKKKKKNFSSRFVKRKNESQKERIAFIGYFDTHFERVSFSAVICSCPTLES